MANIKFTEMGADASPSSDDIFGTVNDPAGTPVNKKVTLGNAVTKAHGLSDGVLKVATGVMAVATAGTDYTTPSSTESFTNKTFNANGTGNALSNVEVADLAASAVVTAAEGLASSDNDTSIPTTAAVIDGLATKQDSGATLTSLEGLSLVAGDILYATAADTLTRLAKGTAGQVLTMNGGATAPSWVASTGYKPYNADIILASSGGDYSTLADVATNATANQVVYVAPGTYSVGAGVSFTQNGLRFIGDNSTDTIININSTGDISFSGLNNEFLNFRVNRASTGDFVWNSAKGQVHHNYFSFSSESISGFQLSADYATFHDNYFECTSTSANVRVFLALTGEYMQITDNRFLFTRASDDSAYGSLRITAGRLRFVGNTVVIGGGTNTGSAMSLQGGDCVITGNQIKCVSSAGVGLLVEGGDRNSITGNTIYLADTGISLASGSLYNTISGNVIHADTAGILVSNSSNSIIGNQLNGSAAGDGILIAAAVDNTLISGNFIYQYTDGIEVNASTCDNTVIVGNRITTCTTAINDAGTGTTNTGNNTA